MGSSLNGGILIVGRRMKVVFRRATVSPSGDHFQLLTIFRTLPKIKSLPYPHHITKQLLERISWFNIFVEANSVGHREHVTQAFHELAKLNVRIGILSIATAGTIE